MQVILIANLTDSVLHNDRGGATIWAVVAGVTVAGFLGAQQMMYTLQRMIQVSIRAQALEWIDSALAALSPSEISDRKVQTDARNARESVLEGKVQMQTASALSAAYSAIVAGSLAWVLWRYSWIAAALVLACLIPLTLASMIYSRRDSRIWPKIAEHRRRAAYLEDQLVYQTSATELATYDASQYVAKSARVGHRASRNAERGLEKGGLILDGCAGLLSAVFLSLAFVSLITDDVEPGAIAGGAVGVLSGMLATSNVGYVMGSLMAGANAIRRFRAFVETRNPRRRTTRPSSVSELAVERLSLTYSNSTRPAVSTVSFTARRGNVTALVGVNGAGKSSIVRAVAGLVSPSAGRILFDRVDVTDMGFDRLHLDVALLAQEFGRYELSIRENLLVGTGGLDRADDVLWAALKAARIDDFVRQLPRGLDTQLGEQWDGIGVSGGQWQRLAIARMVLRDRAIWILDEPTSAIDAEGEAQILEEMRRIAADRIVIFISHRAWTLKNVDIIHVIDDGRIVQSGDYEQLVSSPGRFADIFALQVDRDFDVRSVGEKDEGR